MKYNYQKADPKLWNTIRNENVRQDNDIDLIPSENYVSNAVRAAAGSRLTNKYSEGYPHHRYYGGCENVDTTESLAIERAKKLFKMPYANVQPFSGTEANLEVYDALLEPGDGILAMAPSAGGHISHGSKVSVSSELYDTHFYSVNGHSRIDYHQVSKLAKKYQPKLIICGASAYPRLIDWGEFRKIADSVHAYLLADIAHLAGLVCSGVIPSPAPYADVLTMTTHKTLRGPRGGLILARKQFAKAINKAVFPHYQGGVPQNIVAAKAACFYEALQPSFREYSEQILKNAKTMAKVFNQADGISLLTGGTDNHLMVLDLRHTKMDGETLQNKLEACHITTNKEMIPHDPLPPSKTSGLRVGTPAITTRGFDEADCAEVARLILTVIYGTMSDDYVRDKVHELTSKHPIQD